MSRTVNPAKAAVARRKESAAAAGGGSMALPLTNRQRFLDACHCQLVDRPPIWLMRQAGRALPEYRALRQQHSFLELVQTPELAAEVTLQPIRRFGFDAAILFSDILVVAEGMGQPYQYRDRGGIELEFVLNSAADIERLEESAVTERLQYVARALPLVRSGLGDRTALLGFAGSPWTLANFMLEGAGVKAYTKAKALFYSEPGLFGRLLGKLTRAVTSLLQLQIDAGVDAVQIFDSLGGGLAAAAFGPASACWMKQVIASLKGQAPVIVFAKGVHGNWADLVDTGAQVLGIDCNVGLADVGAKLPSRVAVQGNLDPFLLCTTPAIVAAEAAALLREMRGRPGHIFNLGHGVPPNAKLENLECLAALVRHYRPAKGC
ncbi:MAG: uroporphyrinogen decarboxylase [Verrucomicrobiota bacterium]|jgi:uroporphyrinogen decarboxylase